MKPALRSIDSNGATVLSDHGAETTDYYAFYINATIGFGEMGGDDFQIFICSRNWLDGNEWSRRVEGRMHFVVDGPNSISNLTKWINKYLLQCDGESWAEIACKISQIGDWEYQGHTS